MPDFHLSGEVILHYWLYIFVALWVGVGIWTSFFKVRKIQPKGFKWKTLRNESLFAVVTLAASGVVLGMGMRWLTAHGYIAFDHGPASWWMIAGEYALYFFLFDTWFYWLHRLMHREPIYRWVHKLHHLSTAPNIVTTVSETPFEAWINGGFVPLFLTLFTVHDATVALITPTNIIMGLYVHSGYEFFPRWWNRSWATKWFITATFHDQHHKYFRWNFGGYTTIWDRICGTMRPRFEEDFLDHKDRIAAARTRGAATAE